MHALVAPGVTADGHREILGSGVASADDGAGGWRFCAGWSPAACPACSGYLRCPPRPGRGDRHAAAPRCLAAAHPSTSVGAGGPAGPPPSPGEGLLGSVTIKVQRQTRPSRRGLPRSTSGSRAWTRVPRPPSLPRPRPRRGAGRADAREPAHRLPRTVAGKSSSAQSFTRLLQLGELPAATTTTPSRPPSPSTLTHRSSPASPASVPGRDR